MKEPVCSFWLGWLSGRVLILRLSGVVFFTQSSSTLRFFKRAATSGLISTISVKLCYLIRWGKGIVFIWYVGTGFSVGCDQPGENTLPWLGIEPGPWGGQTVRFIHFPTELSWLTGWRIFVACPCLEFTRVHLLGITWAATTLPQNCSVCSLVGYVSFFQKYL